MRIIFAGTPEFARTTLIALNQQPEHQIVAVYCQPDRRKGRGKKLSACPVKTQALRNNLPIYQPENFKQASVIEQFAQLNADVMVVVAYGQLLPRVILRTPRYGCLNIHASLLPRWRGAAPIQRALLAGDERTGVSIMQMDDGLDTGEVLRERVRTITFFDSAQSLHDDLAKLGAELMVKVLANLANLTPVPQNTQGITYAKKLTKAEAWIDWTQSATQIERQIRAFNLYPIAQTHAKTQQFEDKVLRILAAAVKSGHHQRKPGSVIQPTKSSIYVATGEGFLALKTVQLAGKNSVNIRDFNNAYQLLNVF